MRITPQKFSSYVDAGHGLTISWSREMIIEFLSKQFCGGNMEAGDLLYIQLHTELVELVKDQGIKDRTKILSLIDGAEEYPQPIRSELKEDFEKDEIDFKSALLVNVEDDMPY